MGYVIAAIIVILLVGAFIFFLVNNATRKTNVSDAQDPGADQNPLGIIGSDDETPAGDTSQHADEDAGGAGRTAGGPDDAHVARPVVGGEGEGERSTGR
jgi:hypothetical protein